MLDSGIGARLEAVRKRMAAKGVDVLLVRSTDRFLNEYVPTDESARVWISGFTGSMGEVLITRDRAFVAVDGRYWIQAEQETDKALYEVLRVPPATPIDVTVQDKLAELAAKAKGRKLTVGFDPSKVTPNELARLREGLPDKVSWKPLFPSPEEAARGPQSRESHPGLRLLDEKRFGQTVAEKIAQLKPELEALEIDALLVQKLDDIAYLSNLRGTELPYQATFRSIALLAKDRLFIGMDPALVPREVRVKREPVMFVPESELWTLFGQKTKRKRVGYDPSQNTEQARFVIEAAGAGAVPVDSPVGPMKAKKNKAELQAMRRAFARADAVVEQAQKWACKEVVAGEKVSEADFANKVRDLFEKAGAVGLSFKIISAAGKNGAIIHYSDPSPRRKLEKGELMLLDTGAYWPEGYATDLTRTFLVDAPSAKATAKQKAIYTTVLKGAIAGMRAVLPENAKGYQLDAIVRAPIWEAGYDYAHGTGHGVGINVHEFPPRVGPNSSAVIEEGHVFSIEPGIYLPKFGGVRIENLCTVKKSKTAGFIEVEPLTFSPLDKRLIDTKMLDATEKAWLRDYAKVHGSAARKKLRS